MTDGFSTLPISKNRGFKIPDTHFHRTQLLRYSTLHFTSETKDINSDGQDKMFWLVLVKTLMPIPWDGTIQVEQAMARIILSPVLVAQIAENGGRWWCSHHSRSAVCWTVALACRASLCSELGWPMLSVSL